MRNSKFNFYEVVRVRSNDSELKEINGKEAVILGIVKNDDGKWYYTIGVKDDFAWCVMENQIESLRRFSNSKEHLTGDSVKVLVNEDGEGDLKNPEDEKFFEK